MNNRFRDVLKDLIRRPIVANIIMKIARAGLLSPRYCIFLQLPAKGITTLTTSNGAEFKYVASKNDITDRLLFWGGLRSFEPETCQTFYELAKKAQVVVDVGAHVGIYTLLACSASNSSRIVAFEPVPEARKRLIANIELNRWQDRCEIRSEAVSNDEYYSKIYVTCNETSMSSLNIESVQDHIGDLMDVKVIALDQIFSENTKVDLVKIDVERLEDKVLEGMKGILMSSGPYIILEALPDGPYVSAEKILNQFGYRIYKFTEAGLVSIGGIVPNIRDSRNSNNFLCVPENRGLHELIAL